MTCALKFTYRDRVNTLILIRDYQFIMERSMWLLVAVAFAASISFIDIGRAASVDTVGREFVFAYPTPYYPTTTYSSYVPVLYVVVTNARSEECSATLSIRQGPLFNSLGTQRVRRDAPANVTIPFRSYFGNDFASNIEGPLTIKVTATGDVSVHAFYSYNQRYSTWYTSGTIILPTSALGKEYFTASYQPSIGHYSEFTVSALDEITTVQLRGRDGYRKTQVLQPYETIQHRSTHDLTGSGITADKRISVLSGSSASKIPNNKEYNSYLISHLPAIDGLGKNYVLGPFKDRSSGYVYRVVGTKDNSNVIISGSTPVELHAGEMLDREVPGDNVTTISATQPILVFQFSYGYAMESSKGNAAMVIVPAVDMFSSTVSFPVTSMPSKSLATISINIIIKCEANQGLLLDDVTLAQVWDTLQTPNGKMCILRTSISQNVPHTISHSSQDVTFSVMVYGSAYKVGYAYMAGFNVRSRTAIRQDNSTVQVPDTKKGMSLICEDDRMTIFINKSLVIDGLPSDVHLTDPHCFGRVYGKNWIALVTSFVECGTVVEENEFGSVYKNQLVYEGPRDQSVLIGRDATFNLPITCDFHDRALASLRLAPELSVIDGSLTGHGSLSNVTFALKMYKSQQYKSPYPPEAFPVTVEVGEPMYLEAKATGGQAIQVMIERCLATHSSDPRQKPNYIFIDEGCPTDNTVTFLEGTDPEIQRLSVLAFTLTDGNDPTAIAYIHCWLLACNATDSSSRCTQECSREKKRDLNRHAEDDSHYVVSWGPLIILPKSIRDESNDMPNDSVNQIVPIMIGVGFFILGAMIAAVGIMAYLRRSKTGRLRSWNDDTYELLKMEEPQE